MKKKFNYIILKNFLTKAEINKLENFLINFIYSKVYIWSKNFNLKEPIKSKINKESLYKYFCLLNKPKIFRNAYYYFYCKVIFNLITNKKLIFIVQELLKSKEIYFSGLFNLRYSFPNQKKIMTNWHNDIDSFASFEKNKKKIKNNKMITIWIPLTNVNKKNSSELILKIPGKKNLIEHALLKKGDILIFNSKLTHRSAINRRKNTRWAIDIRFEGSDFNEFYQITKIQGFSLKNFNQNKLSYKKFENLKSEKFSR